MQQFTKLKAYQLAFEQAMDMYWLTREFPDYERYELTSQVRRSSRSVCANIAEGYRKRHYKKHFIAKSSDAAMENSETYVWLEFALACNYIAKPRFEQFTDRNEQIGRLLFHMMQYPERYYKAKKG